RFTFLGHRRLFRQFAEIGSGTACGPGMAMAWGYQYFLLSFTRSRTLRRLMVHFADATAFYLKYFDRFLVVRPGALDGASSLFFLGSRSEQTLSDRALIGSYRGGF